MVPTCVDRVQEAGHGRVAVAAASIATGHWPGIWLVLGLAESVKRCHSHNKAVFRSLKSALYKKRFPVTSNLRYVYGVLNVDKIKN
jgi:hypothetical protein